MTVQIEPTPIPTCHAGHEPINQEYDYLVENIQGELPTNLTGTFFRNGPGRLRVGNQQFGHWFDGDGMLCKFTFNDQQVRFQNRFVRTPKYIKESASGKIEFRGFGTQRSGGVLANMFRPPANPANTNSIIHAGQLLALNEGGRPFRLDPADLSTHGEYNYAGQLTPANLFSAHGKIDPVSGYYVNFGAGVSVGLSGITNHLDLYRINPSGKLDKKSRIPLKTFPFCHDCAITDRYAIYFINSIITEGLGDILLGKATIADQISYRQDVPMQIIVVDLNTLEVVRQFECDDGAIIHFGNAWQQGNELFVDGMYANDFEANEMLKDVFNGEFNGGQYRRYRLNMDTGNVSWDSMTRIESEFPTFNLLKTGQKNQLTFTACSIKNGHASFYNAIQSISSDGESKMLALEPGYYGSEPLFALANDSDEDRDGYVLELLYNSFEHKSELAILRASDIRQEVCRIHLDHHIPHQFHGFFTRDIFV